MSPFFARLGFSFLPIAALVIFVSVPEATSQQPAQLTEPQKAKLRERDQIEKQIVELLGKGKRDETLPLFEQMIALEQAVFGADNLDAAVSFAWLGDVQVARSDWKAAGEAREAALKMYRKLLGEKHWRTVNARLAFADVALLSKLTPEQREKLAQADLLERQANGLYESRKWENALEKDQQALGIRKEILGGHRRTAGAHVRIASDLRQLKNLREALAEDENALLMRLKLLGEENPETAASYQALAEDYRMLKDYPAAEKRDRVALEILRKVRGSEHQDALNSAENLAMDLALQRKFEEAVRLRRFILDVCLRRYGNEDDKTSKAMAALGYLWGSYAESILEERPNPFQVEFGDTEKRLRRIGEIFWGSKAPEDLAELKKKLVIEAAILHDCAYKIRGNGDFEPGNRLQLMAFALRRDILGAHIDTVRSGHLLAWGLNKVGRFQEAEFFDRQTLAMAREALGKKHPLTLQVLRNLAYDVRGQGRYTDAEALDQQSLDLSVEVNGEMHQATASLYNNLGFDLFEQGKYADAEPLFRRALVINLKVLGENHEETLITMSNIGQSLLNAGQTSEAQKIFTRINEIIMGWIKENVDSNFKNPRRVNMIFLARNFSSLAICYLRMGDYKSAESILDTVAFPIINIECILRPQDKILQAEAISLHLNLASACLHLKKYKEALASLREALAISRRTFGDNHPLTMRCRTALVQYLLLRGDFVEAEAELRELVSAGEDILGSTHPEVLRDTLSLVRTLWWKGDYAAAEQFARKAYDNYLAVQLRAGSVGLDRLKVADEDPFILGTPMLYLAAASAKAGRHSEALKFVEENLARGLLEDLSSRASRPLKSEERSEEEAYQGRLTRIDSRIAAFLENKEIDRDAVEKLQIERNQTILKLSEFQGRMEKAYGPSVGQVFQLKEIQAQLQPDAAIIGWLDILGHPKGKEPSGEHWAFVLRASGDPVFVRLPGRGKDGDWEQADYDLLPMAQKFLSEPSDIATEDECLARLYRQRFESLEPHLKARDALPAVRHLIVLPTPYMTRVPLEVLTRYRPDSKQMEAKDRFLVSYAPSGTIYAYLQKNRKRHGDATGSLLAVADPAFTEKEFKIPPGKDPKASDLRARAPNPLPGTRGEVEAIARIFKADGGKVLTLLGTDASAKSLDDLATGRKLQEFRYLHLATHGTPDELGGMNSFLSLSSEDFRARPFDKLTAGHILRSWKLDADLVTLSACETALGQQRGGEGYVGFCQAFFLAGERGVGAQTVVMSQWQVSDLSTAILMERFYQNLLGRRPDLKEPMGKLAALSEAKQYLRELTRQEALARLKAMGLDIDPRTGGPVAFTTRRPFAHPFYWAPFILVGDPGAAAKK